MLDKQVRNKHLKSGPRLALLRVATPQNVEC